MPVVIADIERFLEREPQQKARLPAFAVEYLSDLSLASKLHEEINTVCPWTANFVQLLKRRGTRPNLRGIYPLRLAFITLGHAPDAVNISAVVPSSKKLYYPVEKAP